MTIWMPDLATRGGPKYLAIADAISDAVSSGDLSPGEKLPPQRNLAYDIGVTLGTVTRAYQEAERRGLVGGEVGRGTFVLGDEPDAASVFVSSEPTGTNVFDFTHATPVAGAAGKKLARTLAHIASQPDIDPLANYQLETGLEPHLAAGADWISRTTDLKTSTERVALTNGAQHGVLVALMTVTQPGDTILAESLTYPGIIHLAHQLGVRLEPAPIDDEGLIPQQLDELCAKTKARALYCMPALQNPTTAVMPEERRRQIAAIARRHKLFILEDDIWGGLAGETLAPITAHAPERSFFITGLSKCMAGGLRVGYILAPDDHIQALRTTVRICNWMTAPLMAEVARRWITDGTGDELTDWQRRRARERMRSAQRILGKFSPTIHPSAHHFWLELPSPWRGTEFAAVAESRGVRVLTSETFVVGRQAAPHAIRIGTGFPKTLADLEIGLEILREILDTPCGIGPAVI